MTSAADYATGVTKEVPPDLSRAWRCKRWKCLPRAGGISDQPAFLIYRMETALNVYDAYHAYHQLEPTQITEFHRQNPHVIDVIFLVDKLRNG